MSYDLVLKNGRVVDGSGGPSFSGDVGVVDGRIAEVGKLSATAKRVIDVQGQVISPGFVDNHCHFDAQVLWDPLCTFACYHGATTVINGNCSLGLAPARPSERADLVSMLSRVEAIPVESLQAGVELVVVDEDRSAAGGPEGACDPRLVAGRARSLIRNLDHGIRRSRFMSPLSFRDRTARLGIV